MIFSLQFGGDALMKKVGVFIRLQVANRVIYIYEHLFLLSEGHFTLTKQYCKINVKTNMLAY